jgi:hypothetical protein
MPARTARPPPIRIAAKASPRIIQAKTRAMPTPISRSDQCQTTRSKARKKAETWMPAQPRQLMRGSLRSGR